MEQSCIHCIIEGRVQGVWYRAFAKKKAAQLGITGWAKNLSNGSVEILACGEPKNLDVFRHALLKGPVLAHVSNLLFEEIAFEKHDDFLTR